MSDQASILRGLMRRQAQLAQGQHAGTHGSGPRCLAMVSGKGGVGKTHIALNVAVHLAKAGNPVCLLDMNPGPGNLELLCGLNGYWNLNHVVHGSRTVANVALEGPEGIRILSGGAAIFDSTFRSPTGAQRSAQSQVTEYLSDFRYVILDTAGGDQPLTRKVMRMAHCNWLLTTPELTAIADAYSLVKSCAAEGPLPEIEVLINRVGVAAQAQEIADRMRQTAHSFLQQEIHFAGHIPHDACVSEAVSRREPFVLSSAKAPASKAVADLATRWMRRTSEGPSSFTIRFNEQSRRAA